MISEINLSPSANECVRIKNLLNIEYLSKIYHERKKNTKHTFQSDYSFQRQI